MSALVTFFVPKHCRLISSLVFADEILFENIKMVVEGNYVVESLLEYGWHQFLYSIFFMLVLWYSGRGEQGCRFIRSYLGPSFRACVRDQQHWVRSIPLLYKFEVLQEHDTRWTTSFRLKMADLRSIFYKWQFQSVNGGQERLPLSHC